jgi:hypothetical protein
MGLIFVGIGRALLGKLPPCKEIKCWCSKCLCRENALAYKTHGLIIIVKSVVVACKGATTFSTTKLCITTINIMTLSIKGLFVTLSIKHSKLSAFMLSAVMLSVIMLIVIMLSVIMLSVILLSVLC